MATVPYGSVGLRLRLRHRMDVSKCRRCQKQHAQHPGTYYQRSAHYAYTSLYRRPAVRHAPRPDAPMRYPSHARRTTVKDQHPKPYFFQNAGLGSHTLPLNRPSLSISGTRSGGRSIGISLFLPRQ